MNCKNENICTHYTLVQHLRSCSDIPEYRLLSASADIVREEATQMLDSLCKYYGYYSKHDISHSDHIVSNIELILGEERIKQLSPTDTWMLIISAYWHDVGMYFSPDLIQQEWEKPEFKEFLKSVQRNAVRYYEPEVSGYSLLDAASLFVDEQNRIKTPDEISESIRNWDFTTEDLPKITMISKYTRIEQYIVMLFDEYIRRQHPDLSKKEMEKRLYTKLEMMGIQRRLWLVCGKAAASHGKNIEFILNDFPRITNGVSSDYAHPRFVSILLCLGDLLDADNNRFNMYMIRAAGNLPAESQAHYGKHSCLTHILVNQECIELSYDLGAFMLREKENDTVNEINVNLFVEVFQVVSHWNQMIEDTAEFFRRSWFEIVPDGFPGSAPVVKSKDVYIGENSQPIVVNEVLSNYEINYHRAFGMFSNLIYGHRTTFVRELIQNSIDATKQELHKDAVNLLECLSRKSFDELLKTSRTFCRDYVAAVLMLLYEKNYTVKAKISIRKEGQTTHNRILRFMISDIGVGIDHEAEKRMQHVGISCSDERNNMIHQIPAWIRPTGAFGIGMHAAFSATDEIWVRSIYQDRNYVFGSTNLVLTSQKKGSQIVHIPNQLAASKRRHLGTDISLDVRIKGNRGLFQNEEKELTDSKLYDLISQDFQNLLSESIIPFQGIFHVGTDSSPRFIDPLTDRRDRTIKLYIKHSNLREGDNKYGLLTPFIQSIINADLSYGGAKFDNKSYFELDKTDKKQYWASYLDKIRYGDSYIVRDQGVYYILNLNHNDILDDREKNILLCVSFVRARHYRKEAPDEGEVSFKGAWIDQRKQYSDYHKHLSLPRLSYSLHILGRPAQSTVPASREYLLPEAVEDLQNEMNQALDDVIEYIAFHQNESENEDSILPSEEERLNFILYAYKYLWRRKGSQQNKVNVVQKTIKKMSEETSSPWTYKYIVADRSITYNYIALSLTDPLSLWYEHKIDNNRISIKNMTNINGEAPEGVIDIYADPWVDIEPDIVVDEIRHCKHQQGTLFYIHYQIGQSARLMASMDTIKEYLKLWVEDDNPNEYIPAFSELDNLGISYKEVPIQNRLGLFSAYIKMPTFLPGKHDDKKATIKKILEYVKMNNRSGFEEYVNEDSEIRAWNEFIRGISTVLLNPPDPLNGNVDEQIMSRYGYLLSSLFELIS